MGCSQLWTSIPNGIREESAVEMAGSKILWQEPESVVYRHQGPFCRQIKSNQRSISRSTSRSTEQRRQMSERSGDLKLPVERVPRTPSFLAKGPRAPSQARQSSAVTA